MNLFSSAQVAWLRQAMAVAEDGSIPGTWLTAGSIPYDRLLASEVTAALDTRYAPIGLSGTHSLTALDASDGYMYLWSYRDGVLVSKERVLL